MRSSDVTTGQPRLPDDTFQVTLLKATEDERADQNGATDKVPTVCTKRNDADAVQERDDSHR